MSTYLAINLAIIAVPLLLTFLPFFRFYRYWKPLLVTILIVGGLFIFWDGLVTMRGDWLFNPTQIIGLKIFFLPIEEWLFFITVPYSCLFLYEGILLFFRDIPVLYSRRFYVLLSAAILLEALFLRQREYSLIVLLVLAAVFLLAATVWREMFLSGLFWFWIGLGMMLFLLFNYLLTSLPVVTYNPQAFSNVRIATIPLEDFLYNFSLLSLYLGTYLWAKKKLKIK